MCLSEYLSSHKDEYFDKLSSTQRGNGFLPWVKFFVRAICDAAEKAMDRIKQFNEIVNEDQKQLTTLSRFSKHMIPIYSFFKKHLISEIKPISEQLGISYNTAAKWLKF